VSARRRDWAPARDPRLARDASGTDPLTFAEKYRLLELLETYGVALEPDALDRRLRQLPLVLHAPSGSLRNPGTQEGLDMPGLVRAR